MATRIKAPTLSELEERARVSDVPGTVEVTYDEWMAMFDEAVQEQLGMSGEEFIERWNAGEYAEIADKAGHRHLIDLAMLIPIDRRAT
jgi:hypothetical protein